MKLFLKIAVSLTLAGVLAAACKSDDTWAVLNSQAEKEYLEPIRQGGIDGSPFWNIYADKFLYAPAFDIAEVEAAAKYCLKIYSRTDEPELAAEFKADSPKAALSPVWNRLAPDHYKLVVEALDENGNVIGEAGSREFFRDFPFHGPYPQAARDYREAAIKGLLYIHNLPFIRAWAEGNGPDMSYPMNGYVCKIIGATVRIECLLAREIDEIHDDAMARALGAAQYLVDKSQAEGAPLAGWPPTYGERPLEHDTYVDQVIVSNEGRTMTEEATVVGEAFLDLFDATADSVWFRRSLRIARTYAKIQTPEGAWPVKLDYNTGEPICKTRIFPTHLLQYLRRLNNAYGVTEFNEVRAKAEKYMNDNVLPSFDMTGQFEDNLSDWTDPYSNLTNITGSGYSAYLLKNENVTDEDARNCTDMIRLSEDQFVHWDNYPDWLGFKRTIAPCVHEQHAYEEAIDDSAATVAEGYMSLYEYNGDPLALAKAQALLGSITRAQYAVTGRIPTVMAWNGGYDEPFADCFWLNCSWWSACALLRMDSILNN